MIENKITNKHLICYRCGSYLGLEKFNNKEYACKECRTHYKLSDITDEEMIEWFVE